MNVKVDFKPLLGRGFGAFIKDSVKKTGSVEVYIDIDAMLNCVAANTGEISFREIFTESLVHEIMHGIEELYGMSFNDDAIEDAISFIKNECS